MFKFTIIARREFTRYLNSPISWLILCLWALLTGFFFVRFLFFQSGAEAKMSGVMQLWAWTLIPFIPAISMRLFAEELRSGSIEVLMSRPVSEIQVTLGKFFGAYAYLFLMMLVTVPQVIILELFSSPDYGPIISAYVGLLLVAALYLAISLFASALSKDQVMVFMISIFVILFFTLVMALLPRFIQEYKQVIQVLNYINIIFQSINLQRGLLEVKSLVFFLSGIFLFLALTIKVLEARRWSEGILKYGPNVVIQILLLLAILGGLNYAAHDQAQNNRFPKIPSRLDLTNIRAYTLSEQSQKIMQQLEEPVKITSLYTYSEGDQTGQERQDRIEELLKNYHTNSGGKIQVNSIDPFNNFGAYTQFKAEIRERYRADIQQRQDLIQQSLQLMQQEKTEIKSLLDAFREKSKDQNFDMKAALSIQSQALQLSHVVKPIEEDRDLSQLQPRDRDDMKQVDRLTRVVSILQDEELPDYQFALLILRQHFEFMSSTVFPPILGSFEEMIKSHPELSQEATLAVHTFQKLSDLREAMSTMIGKIAGIQASEYSSVRQAISENTLVISNSKRLVVLPSRAIFPQQGKSQEEMDTPPIFRGEEAITGAILSLNLELMPQIVFLSMRDNPQAHDYFPLIQPLVAMGFQVLHYNPVLNGGSGGPVGQPPRQMALPQPQPGQRQIIVIPPSPGVLAVRSIAAQKQVLNLIQNQLGEESRDSRMLFLVNHNPHDAAYEGSIDILGELKQFGILVENNKLIYTEEVTPQRTRGVNQMEVSDWPESDPLHPVPAASKGLLAMLFQAVPIKFTKPLPLHIKTWVLMNTPASTWAEIANSRNPGQFDNTDEQGPFHVAVAAEDTSRNHRVVVIGAEPMFRLLNQRNQAENLSQKYPANLEIFLNSVYWLAGMEEMIAATPRTQSVPRIREMPDQHLQLVWGFMLVGLPAGLLFLAGFVWFKRRK